MQQNQAINALIAGVRIGQGKGAYTLEESAVILEAIKVFTPSAPVEEPKKEEKVEEGVDKKD